MVKRQETGTVTDAVTDNGARTSDTASADVCGDLADAFLDLWQDQMRLSAMTALSAMVSFRPCHGKHGDNAGASDKKGGGHG